MDVRRRLPDQALVGAESLIPDALKGDIRRTHSNRDRERTPRSSRASLQTRADACNTIDRMPDRDALGIIRDQGRKSDNQLRKVAPRQNKMESNANHLVDSLAAALSKFGESLTRKDASMQMHDEAIHHVKDQNRIIAAQNRKADQIDNHQQDVPRQQQERSTVIQKVQELFQNQPQRLGAHEIDAQTTKAHLHAMTAEDKNRPTLPPATEEKRPTTSTWQNDTGYSTTPL